jgi:hypothetical protein
MMKPRSQYGRTLSRHVALGAPAFGDGGPGLGEAVRAKPKETEEAQKTDTLAVERFRTFVVHKPQTTTFQKRLAVRQLLAGGTFKMSGKPIPADSVFKATLAVVNNALTTVMPATPVAEADEDTMVAAGFDRQIEQDIPDYKTRIAAMHERLDAILARE